MKRPVLCCLAWLNDRHIRVDRIVVDMSMVEELEYVQTGCFQVQAVRCIGFVDPSSTTAASGAGIRQFLSYFPSLVRLNFNGCTINDGHLLQLLHLKCPLLGLYLGGSTNLAAGVVAAVLQNCPLLDSLGCDVLDDWAITGS